MAAAGGEFRVDGYVIQGLLSAGPTGELWLALRGDRQVGLKRVRPNGLDAHDEARRLVSTLRTLGHPHLTEIHELLPYCDDELVLVTDYADGRSLDQLLLARPVLDPGEVVTIAATIAHTLAAVHQRGLVHGDLTPESIVFTEDGRPILTDVGLAALVERPDVPGTFGYSDPAQPPAPTKESDIYALAAVCYAALSGTTPQPGARVPLRQVAPGTPSALAHAIEAGLGPQPGARPDAATFADQLEGGATPVAVRFPDAPEISEVPFPPADQSPSRAIPPDNVGQFTGTGVGDVDHPTSTDRDRRIPPWLWLVAGAIPLVVAGVLLGAKVFGGAPTTRSTPAPEPARSTTASNNGPALVGRDAAEFAQVFDDLEANRGAAYVHLDDKLLALADQPGSKAFRGDVRNMADYRAEGYVGATGLRRTLKSMRVVDQTDRQVVLDVVLVINRYRALRRGPDGTLIEEPAVAPEIGKPIRHTIVLVPDGKGGWLIASDN